MRSEVDAVVAALALVPGIIRDESLRGRTTSKGGRDLVTAADIAVEDAIRLELQRRYPDYPVVGEERGGTAGESGRPYWLLDPICGTRAFASGLPLYCTNLALVENGRAVCAGVAEGAEQGRMYVAEESAGAWQRSGKGLSRVQVSDASPIICCDANGTRAGVWTPHAARFLSEALLRDRWYVWMLPTTLPYAYLASGRIAGIVQFGASSPVHFAAGCLLASEAGALVTDLEGHPWSVAGTGFVAAAAPSLHADLLGLVAETRSLTTL